MKIFTSTDDDHRRHPSTDRPKHLYGTTAVEAESDRGAEITLVPLLWHGCEKRKMASPRNFMI